MAEDAPTVHELIDKDTDEEDEAEEKTLTEKLPVHHKVDTEKDFTELGKRDTILFDTPIEGLKTGELTDREESWSGVVEAKVDTGAKQYTLTPFDDDYSAKYVGVVDSTLTLDQGVLERLESATLQDISTGEDVVIDVPKMGPTRATVSDIVESKNQGLRGTLKVADSQYFVVYEEPSATQTTEQAYIVGRESDI